MTKTIALTGISLLAALLACGTSSTGDTCTAYVVPTSTDLTTPVTSFKTDVMPVFQASCAISTSCHTGTTNTGGLYLGDNPATAATPSAVRSKLVGVVTPVIKMPLVTASDPGNSFLMHKMDGDICTLASQCVGSCGATMPNGGMTLPTATRDIVRRWIAQGAGDN